MTFHGASGVFPGPLPKFHLLIATVPRRRAMVESLLCSVAARSATGQPAVPEFVHLVLDDGYYYEKLPSPEIPAGLTVREYRLPPTGGPGGRWRVVKEIPEDVILVNLDDDQCLGSTEVLWRLVHYAGSWNAAVSYMGMSPTGAGGVLGTGELLVSIAAGVFAVRASALADLNETLSQIRRECGFDPFGILGDDDAVISAHLWRTGVAMRATGPLTVHEAPGAQVASQFEKRRDQKVRDGRSLFWQRAAIAKLTGWPWVNVANL